MACQAIDGRHSQTKSSVEESEPSKMNCGAILVKELTEVLSKSVDNLRDGRSWGLGTAKASGSVEIVVALFMSIRQT
jgi:hypothetical protein